MILRNDRTNETINTTMTNAEAAARFSELLSGRDNWLWFHIHRTVQRMDRDARETGLDGAIQFIADSFLLAIGNGLKRPQLRLHFRDQRFKLYLSSKGTICVKTGALAPGSRAPVGDEYYIGCLLRGDFLAASERVYDPRTGDYRDGAKRKLTETEQAFLDGLKADPVGFVAACGRDMGRCCYCYLPLEDARSKEVGYGSTCAKRWGLPWGKSAAEMEKAPSFAKIYGHSTAMLCQAVRQSPRDEFAWNVLSDHLKERSSLQVKMPESGVIIPRCDTDATTTPLKKAAPVIAPEGVEVSTGSMTYDTLSKTFHAEASTLTLPGFPMTLKVKSDKTGDVKEFTRSEDERDVVGDLTAVRYVCGELSLRIVND